MIVVIDIIDIILQSHGGLFLPVLSCLLLPFCTLLSLPRSANSRSHVEKVLVTKP